MTKTEGASLQTYILYALELDNLSVSDLFACLDTEKSTDEIKSDMRDLIKKTLTLPTPKRNAEQTRTYKSDIAFKQTAHYMTIQYFGKNVSDHFPSSLAPVVADPNPGNRLLCENGLSLDCWVAFFKHVYDRHMEQENNYHTYRSMACQLNRINKTLNRLGMKPIPRERLKSDFFSKTISE